MYAVSVYWTLLAARWCLWIYGRVMGDASGRLAAFHQWLGWPFTAAPGIREVALLPDLLAVSVSGLCALGMLGVLAGWSGERARRAQEAAPTERR